MNPFAIADIEKKALGRRISEKDIQQIFIHDFTKNIKQSFNDQPQLLFL